MIDNTRIKRTPKKKVVTDPIVLTRTEPQHPVGLIAALEKAHCEYDVFLPNRKEMLGVDLPDAPPNGTFARRASRPLEVLVYLNGKWHGQGKDIGKA